MDLLDELFATNSKINPSEMRQSLAIATSATLEMEPLPKVDFEQFEKQSKQWYHRYGWDEASVRVAPEPPVDPFKL